ncbi:MAG: hypothetical protein ACE149_09995 [Armatimonadota bacterium]
MSGQTTGISEQLVARKIAVYCNVGNTIAPEPILSLLRSRTKTNVGNFLTPEEEAAHEEAAAQQTEEEQPEAERQQQEAGDEIPWQNGMVRGVVGKRIGVNGVLDLRGVPADQVAAIEEIAVNGVVLMDEGNRNSLAGVKAAVNGSIIAVPPDMRVMMEPEIELSKASVEAMPNGQKLMIVGNMFLRPDIPPALIAEKFEDLRLVGIIVMGEGVQGALIGRGEITGVTILIPAGVTEAVRSIGNNTWTADYLSRLPDNIAYINIGNTRVPASA